LARALAHEISHAVFGTADVFRLLTEIYPATRFEDDVMREHDGIERQKHYNFCIGEACANKE
jgi:hypothetical protein